MITKVSYASCDEPRALHTAVQHGRGVHCSYLTRFLPRGQAQGVRVDDRDAAVGIGVLGRQRTDLRVAKLRVLEAVGGKQVALEGNFRDAGAHQVLHQVEGLHLAAHGEGQTQTVRALAAG